MHHKARFWDFGSADQMNTDINDASIPICNVSMSALTVRWRHTWHMTLAIHFDPQCQYCIGHVTYYDEKLFECWPAVSDVGPSLKQQWVNVSCLLGSAPVINSRPNTATLTVCDCPAVCVFACMLSLSQRYTQQHSADTRSRWINVGSTFVHHLRRWTNVLSQLWFNVLSLLGCQYTCVGPI